MAQKFWREVITIAYILNKCIIAKLKLKVPEEAWSGRKSSVICEASKGVWEVKAWSSYGIVLKLRPMIDSVGVLGH